MAVGDTYAFPGFLTPVLTQLFFPKPLATFLTCFCIGERQKYAKNESHLNRGSNSQPPGHESDMLTTEPSGWGKNKKIADKGENTCWQHCLLYSQCFQRASSSGSLKSKGFYGK